MKNKVESSYDFLIEYSRTNNKRERLFLIKKSKKDNILAIIEIILNTLTGTIDIDSDIIQTLRPYKHIYRKLKRFNSLNWREAKQIMSRSRNETAIHKLIKLFITKIL